VKTKLICGWVGLSVLGWFGCAHDPPPQELIEARSIYTRAASGPAAQHAAARLQLAQQALAQAELAYGAAPRAEVQDRAYIAIRRAEAAEAEASTVTARERRMTALRELSTLTGTHADSARAELARAEQRATEASQRAQAGEARANSEQARADSEQARAQAGEARASSEQARAQAAEEAARTQQARAVSAEARAQQAMEQLQQLAQVKQESRGVVITLSGQVLFANDQAQLLPASQAALDNVATALKQVPADSPRVVVEGHTDAVGNRSHNLDLARRRAEAVRDFLVARGVNRALFTVQGIGPDRPVADNDTSEGRANNRRVEIVVPSTALALEKVNAPDSTHLQPARAIGGANEPRPAAARPAATPSTTVPAATPAATPPAPAGPAPASPSSPAPASPGGGAPAQ
jgi:outer membrane protein OmpA-like peptidoglycan-associated protein